MQERQDPSFIVVSLGGVAADNHEPPGGLEHLEQLLPLRSQTRDGRVDLRFRPGSAARYSRS